MTSETRRTDRPNLPTRGIEHVHDRAERYEFYELAKRATGDRFAELMIKAVPPDPERLATKDDLTVLGSDLRTEMADLRTDLRTEMAEVRTEVRTGLAGVDARIEHLRAEARDLTAEQTRTVMLWLVVSITALTLAELLVGGFG